MSNRVTQSSTGGSGGGIPLSDFKSGVTPTGTVDGVNTVFIIPDTYGSATLTVYIDGQTELAGTISVPNDYYTSGASNLTINCTVAPTQWIRVNYIKQP